MVLPISLPTSHVLGSFASHSLTLLLSLALFTQSSTQRKEQITINVNGANRSCALNWRPVQGNWFQTSPTSHHQPQLARLPAGASFSALGALCWLTSPCSFAPRSAQFPRRLPRHQVDHTFQSGDASRAPHVVEACPPRHTTRWSRGWTKRFHISSRAEYGRSRRLRSRS